MPENKEEDWRNPEQQENIIAFDTTDVSSKDVFKLAKVILLFCAGIYLVIGGLRIFMCTDGIKEVWEHCKVCIPSIATLVLGVYFTTKKSS